MATVTGVYNDTAGFPIRRTIFYALWIAASCLAWFSPLIRFVRYSLSNDNASHVVLIPAICASILFVERRRIFASVNTGLYLSFIFLALSGAAWAFARFLGSHWSELNRLSTYILSLILFWIAGFVLFFGSKAFRAARFPLAFVFLTIPIPDFLLEKSIRFLQAGTTEIAAVLFDWSGVPVLRDGFVFHLAHVNIEVARECSGIRSSLALLILAILVAHYYLRSMWRRALFVIVGIFVMVLKNGVRVVTLTLLASYVDPGFLYGRLHREGGVVFFLLGLAILLPVLLLLERGERPAESAPAKPAAS